MTSAEARTLGTPRFQCLACGACCHGVRVELVSDEEQARIRRIAVEMGVPDPVQDGWLRQDGGRCRFQQEDGLCGIHARYGEPAKPALCRQFPYVVVQTEQGLRAGIDPSSFNILATWDTAPEVTDLHGEPRRAELDPANQRAEAAVLAWCGAEGATVASVLGRLCGDASAAPDLPGGFASRLATRLRAMRLDLILQARDAGPAQRDALLPLVALIERLDPASPPPWSLPARQDAFAVEVARRMVFLRLATRIPIVQAVALLTLAGAVANGWAAPEPERFGPAMASWSRLLRAGSFWQSLAPDPRTLQWLATGQGG